MSCEQDQFTDYKSIMLKPIIAMDKHTFQAVGVGNLQISIPNGTLPHMQIELCDVLYVP